ncbi:UDP-glucose 4-epimerase GalE [Bradyrhizobium sp. sBnM-33]|uniref:UDP-glucose 4-epimerase GalE n=1 Tax=Bradyrhizobium sp. sBnM-33 TaxID=2831780 RepID=UPI001BCBEE7D|nr:UDP-glucose 4-epimerase GalE [Bradyrhizobium sp. sBnM-33]WOH53891.1 UDP-glucose 4-epimerase GalE [Bradyrhizobium sp. sBnM-33]
MTILITGGAGYIGGQTVLSFVDRGEIPVVLDDLSTGNRRAVPPNVPFYLGDVGDTELMLRIFEAHAIDSILHFAAKLVVPESMVDPLAYYLNNTVKTRALLEAAVTGKIRHFVFSSTAAVYGNPNSLTVNEQASPSPLSPYGMSKLMSEYILRDTAAAYDLNYVILRYFNVAGADPICRHGQSTSNATHLIKVAIETALGRQPHMKIFGNDYATPDGTCVRDYVHISDLANAHLIALDHLRRGGESQLLNCGYGRGYSVKEVIAAVRSITGVDFEVHQGPRRAGDPASLIANNDGLVRLGWKPELNDLPTIVSHALAWEKSCRV